MDIRSLHDLIEHKYGVKTAHRVNPVVTQIEVTITKFLQGNPRRVSFVITNVGAAPIYMTPDNLPSTTRGIYLAPNGGSASLTWEDDFELLTYPWHAIASGAASECIVIENYIS